MGPLVSDIVLSFVYQFAVRASWFHLPLFPVSLPFRSRHSFPSTTRFPPPPSPIIISAAAAAGSLPRSLPAISGDGATPPPPRRAARGGADAPVPPPGGARAAQGLEDRRPLAPVGRGGDAPPADAPPSGADAAAGGGRAAAGRRAALRRAGEGLGGAGGTRSGGGCARPGASCSCRRRPRMRSSPRSRRRRRRRRILSANKDLGVYCDLCRWFACSWFWLILVIRISSRKNNKISIFIVFSAELQIVNYPNPNDNSHNDYTWRD